MTPTRPPKKSETLEVRIPYAAKAAFMESCRREGVTASDTVRGLIEDHLTPAPSASPRPGRLAWRLAAGLAAAAAMGAVAAPALARAGQEAAYQRLDRDRDGALSLAELSRLDVDGDGRVSPAEWRRGIAP